MSTDNIQRQKVVDDLNNQNYQQQRTFLAPLCFTERQPHNMVGYNSKSISTTPFLAGDNAKIESIRFAPADQSQQTEIPHVKTTQGLFTFNPLSFTLRHNTGEFDNPIGNAPIIQLGNNTSIICDNWALIGQKDQAGNDINYGLETNPHTVSVDPFIINAGSEIADLNRKLNKLRDQVIKNTQCSAGDVKFLMFGQKIRDIVNGLYGAGQVSGKNLIRENFSESLIEGLINYSLVDLNISEEDKIIAYNQNRCILHVIAEPAILKQFYSDEKMTNVILHRHYSNAVEVIRKGDAIKCDVVNALKSSGKDGK